MFANLVESGSHRGAYARSGKFFLGTLTVYALAFLAIGVGSIYAYNAHIENDSLQLISLVTPIESVEVQPVQNRSQSRLAGSVSNNSRAVVVRTPPRMVTTDSRVIPNEVSVTPSRTELPDGTIFRIGNPGPGNVFGGGTGQGAGNSTGGNGSSGNSRMSEVVAEAPPPLPIKKETKPAEPPRIVSKGVINGSAVYLPKPVYSTIARAAHASGQVTVQVLIDENGRVVSAKAVGGNPLLFADSVQAAYRARFTPTMLSEQPVKVSGIITYNFMMQ
ncbi:MAG: energy transducer TonB [Acidobacteriota bacterium]|nr:energy transducer TonB [Acidobacteriota bacterium]